MKTAEVICVYIANREYRIKLGRQDPKYIKTLSTYVDNKIKELEQIYPKLDFQKLLILTCLNITDELSQLKRTQHQEDDLYDKLLELKTLIDDPA